jgi:hypothetical protein
MLSYSSELHLLESKGGSFLAKRKSRKKKRKMRRPPEFHREFISRLEEKGLLKGRKLLYQPEGYDKMSAVVWDFIEPYMEYAPTYEALGRLIVLAILAWNASMLPDDEAKAMVERVVNSQPLSQSDHDMMIDVVEDLIERRKKHFAQYTADILDYKLTETEDEFRLSVVSFVRSNEDTSEKE